MIEQFPQQLISGILIMMPPEVQRVAIPTISRYAPSMLQWVPAHMTLIIPFAPVDLLDDACDKLRDTCATIEPFEITLDGYGHWPEGGAYMRPANPQAVQRLFRVIFTEFPQYPPYEGKFGTDLEPHVTVAHTDVLAQHPEAVFPAYAPITFQVNRVHVVYGSFAVPVPFIIHDVIPLGHSH